MAQLNQTEWERLPEAAPTGGWRVLDQEIIAEQRGVVWELIKQLGQTITQGASLTSIAIPVRIAEPRSYLELATDGWCYSDFLKKAAASDDPVERMKYVVTFVIAGLSNTCTPKKPFNPILGETFEATFSDGTEVFCEQVSHHPPISNWEVIGPDNCFHFYGSGELTASFRGNSIKGHQEGVHVVEFNDGSSIRYNLPEAWVRGIMWGDRILEYEGVLEFIDKKNRISAQVKINPETGGWFGWKKKLPSDYIEGGIFKHGQNANQKTQVARIEGSWLGIVVVNGEKIWSFKDPQVNKYKAIPVENPLPSDCRFRNDIIFLREKDLDQAAHWKHQLEELQRRDARLRKAFNDKHGIVTAGH